MTQAAALLAPVRVLVADDSDSLRLLMQMTLDDHPGFSVVGAAADGVEAVELAAAEQPDIVLLDIAMPRMDGLEAIAGIRSRCPKAKIAMFSGFSESRMGAVAKAAGADVFLEKAAPDEHVFATLLELCGRPAMLVPRAMPRRRVPRVRPINDIPVELLLDSLEEAVLITDAAGVVHNANFSAARILGVPTSRLVGSHVADLGLDEAVGGGPVSAALAIGRPLSGVEIAVHRPDGRVVYLLASVRPVQRPGGAAPEGAVASFVDLTARRTAENAASDAATRFRTALDTMLDAVGLYTAVRDRHGRVVDFVVDHVNAATSRVVGQPVPELVGRRLLDLYPTLRGTPLFAAYARVVETGQPLQVDAMDHRSGEHAHLERGAYDVRAARMGDGLVVTWRRVGRRAGDRPMPLNPIPPS